MSASPVADLERLAYLREKLRVHHRQVNDWIRDYPGTNLMFTPELKRAYLDAMEESNLLESRLRETRREP